jgi:hypothetical protein
MRDPVLGSLLTKGPVPGHGRGMNMLAGWLELQVESALQRQLAYVAGTSSHSALQDS